MEGKVPNRLAIKLNFLECTKSNLGFTKVLWETGELSTEEIQHVSVIVSKANRCDCTGAIYTILVYGLGGERVYAEQPLESGSAQISDRRLLAITVFAEKVNERASRINDDDTKMLQKNGLTNKGVNQVIRVVTDFASYNRLNLALDTDYDYDSFGDT